MVDVTDFERINSAFLAYKSNFQIYYEIYWSKRCLLSNLAQAQIPEQRNEYVLNRWVHEQWHHVI